MEDRRLSFAGRVGGTGEGGSGSSGLAMVSFPIEKGASTETKEAASLSLVVVVVVGGGGGVGSGRWGVKERRMWLSVRTSLPKTEMCFVSCGGWRLLSLRGRWMLGRTEVECEGCGMEMETAGVLALRGRMPKS